MAASTVTADNRITAQAPSQTSVLRLPPINRFAQHFVGGVAHQTRIHLAHFPGVGAQQCPVADDVDEPRDAPGHPLHGAQSRGGEDGRHGAGHREPVVHVGAAFGGGERCQVIAAGDALRQLAQFRARQQLTQLRLAHQDDLQELLLAGLQIGEQPHLFQHFRRQSLGLVDDEHHAPAAGMGLQQVRVQGIDEVLGGLVCRVQRMCSSRQMLRRNSSTADPRVDDERRIHVVRQLLQQVRTRVVLPVPTSPVSWMKPPLSVTPYKRCARASVCRADRNRSADPG